MSELKRDSYETFKRKLIGQYNINSSVIVEYGIKELTKIVEKLNPAQILASDIKNSFEKLTTIEQEVKLRFLGAHNTLTHLEERHELDEQDKKFMYDMLENNEKYTELLLQLSTVQSALIKIINNALLN